MARSRVRRVLSVVHRVWITAGIAFFVVFTGWSLWAYRASATAWRALESDARVTVGETETHWQFQPADRSGEAGPALVFFPGALVDPVAYAPLLRRTAEAGYPAVLVKVPRRGAFGGAEGPEPLRRARQAMQSVPASRWVVAGHSRGAEIAARMLARDPAGLDGLVLIGSSHPRDISLARVTIPVTRVYGTRDTVADFEKQDATRHNLPATARWVGIDGGNHSQFGDYGFQPGDWPATISRAAQQDATLEAILEMLGGSAESGGEDSHAATADGHGGARSEDPTIRRKKPNGSLGS